MKKKKVVLTVNEWVKKHSPFDSIYSRRDIADIMGITTTWFRKKANNEGLGLLDQSIPEFEATK